MSYYLRKANQLGDEFAYWGRRPHSTSSWLAPAFAVHFPSAQSAADAAQGLANDLNWPIEICVRSSSGWPPFEVRETVRPKTPPMPWISLTTSSFSTVQPKEVTVSTWEGEGPRPAYYEIKLSDGKVIDPFDIIEACELNFNLGCVVKYVLRAGRKTPDKVDDLKKARNCLSREIKRLSRKPK